MRHQPTAERRWCGVAEERERRQLPNQTTTAGAVLLSSQYVARPFLIEPPFASPSPLSPFLNRTNFCCIFVGSFSSFFPSILQTIKFFFLPSFLFGKGIGKSALNTPAVDCLLVRTSEVKMFWRTKGFYSSVLLRSGKHLLITLSV